MADWGRSTRAQPHEGTPLGNLLQPSLRILTLGLLLATALSCWRCYHKQMGVRSFIPEFPLVGLPHCDPNTYFRACLLSLWTEAGIVTLSDCYELGTLILLMDPMGQTDLLAGHSLMYEALSWTFRDLWGQGDIEPLTPPILQLLLPMGAGSQLIAWFYRALNTMAGPPLGALGECGMADQGRDLLVVEWGRLLTYPPQRVSRNNQLKYIQYNYTHMIYLMQPRPCPPCVVLNADVLLMTWGCTHLCKYWEQVLAKFNVTLCHSMGNAVEICWGSSLGPSPISWDRFVDLALTLAKRRIVVAWKATVGPKVEMWVRDVMLRARAKERAQLRAESRAVRRPTIEDGDS
ncbi:hypothetical protein NDU88_009141 [Pleurodeles waltl]|uniref:Uncharacterized protein n=1 Tax=Pleurodeles waltl TaxID=8319 RepID=A0AAV7P2D9_PLEWA|nr:hypothetical protein NDU88_009141 [Pleurodeles waltl]